MANKKHLSSDLKQRIVNYVNSANSYEAAGERFEVPKFTIQSIITKFKKTNTVETAPRSGRKRKMKPG